MPNVPSRAFPSILLALALALAAAAARAADVQVFAVAGGTPAALQSTVDAFRANLGALNANTAGSRGSGRREINWDGVPDTLEAPNDLPPDFFNTTSPRGVVLTTPGKGFQVSAREPSDLLRFNNLNPTYFAEFQVFSPQRLFTALSSNVFDVEFRIPGSTTPAQVSGFGAVFTNATTTSSSIELFDAVGNSLGRYGVPVSERAGLSFVGVAVAAKNIARVRVTAGNAPLGDTDAPPKRNMVVLDDFIYGEPLPVSPLEPKVGLWWNPDESGTGYNIDIKHGTLVLTVYSFKPNGDPQWYIASGTLSNSGKTFIGVLDKVRYGQCISCVYLGLPQSDGNDGTVRIEFSAPDAGVMTLPGNRVFAIRPQAF